MTAMAAPRALPLFLAALCLSLLLAACGGEEKAEEVGCTFYDIPAMPTGWRVSMPPGINNEESRSLANYYNNDENASVTINIAPTEGKTLAELAASVYENLKSLGSQDISEPVPDGPLMRFEGSFTGQERSVLWIGTNDDVMALTSATGNMDACDRLLGAIVNADPVLLPKGVNR